RIHYLHDITEVSAGVGFQVNLFVHAIGQPIAHLAGQRVHAARQFVGAKIDGSVAHHRNQQSIFLVRVLHRRRIIYLGHVHADALLQHRRDDHEDDQQHQHNVDHGGDVDVGVDV